MNEDFTPEHFVLCPGISDDIDTLYERAISFLDLVGNIDQSVSGRTALGQNDEIDIATGAIIVRNRFRVIVQLFGRVDATLLHSDDFPDFLFRGHLVAGERHSIDVIKSSFLNSDGNYERTAMLALAADF